MPPLFAVDDFLQAWYAMGDGVFAEFDADVAAIHFVSDGGCGAGAKEAVKNKVPGI